MFVLKTIWHRTFKYKGLKWGFRWKRYSKLFLWKILVFVEITWILRIGSYWFNKLRKKTHIFFDMIWIYMNSIFGENSSFLLKKTRILRIMSYLHNSRFRSDITQCNWPINDYQFWDEENIWRWSQAKSLGFYIDSNVY